MVGEYICYVTVYFLQEVEVTPRWTLSDYNIVCGKEALEVGYCDNLSGNR